MKNSGALIVLFSNIAVFILCVSCNGKNLSHITEVQLSDAIFGFENIQDSTKTKVWWFHGETETTREGITADLEAYMRAGIGGVVFYDQTHGDMENALDAFSPEWWKMLRFSSEEAERLGLTFEINISNGFVAGGPWITNELGMKRLVATETLVKGGGDFKGKLPAPKNRYNYYKDVAVIACKAPVGAGVSSISEKVVFSSNKLNESDLNNIFDPGIDKLTEIAVSGEEEPVYVDMEFPDGFTARSITYEVAPRGKATTSATNVPAPPSDTFTGTGYRVLPDLGQLEVSDDGVEYHRVCDLKPIYRAHESWKQKTISFDAVSGRFFRLKLHDWWEENSPRPMQLGKVVLHSSTRTDQWEEKAGLYTEYIENDKTPHYSRDEIIDANEIIDLTAQMAHDGSLNWRVPEGDWLVLRFAYVPTGAKIKHGRTNLMGMECDKLSRKAAEIHWNNYAQRIIDSLRQSGSGKLQGVIMDSHEAGSQNWTDNFIEDFIVRRGYNPIPYLPAMMGYVVGNTQMTDGFLHDVRRNIADMIADNYYGTFERLSKREGITLTAQAIGNALCIVGDPILAKSKVSKPQGEFWAIHPDGNYDIKESSSAAHLYGKQIASAEAFTDIKFDQSLAYLKSLADYAFAYGINEFAVCASAYQPWLDKIPGNTGGGRHYCLNRNNTYWSYSKPFWDYQARTSFVLRQGKPSAQLCIYLGENAPVKILTHRLPEIPGGYDFDAFTSDALFNRMDVASGKIVLPDGVDYQMMILPRNGEMTFDALKKLSEMIKKGAILYGTKPVQSGSAKDFGKDDEYRKLANDVWGVDPSPSGYKQFGKGKIFWGISLHEALKIAQIKPDLALKIGNVKDSKIYFNRRQLSDSDVYFIDNHKDSPEENDFTFSTERKYAQIWEVVSGKRYSLNIKSYNENRKTVALRLEPRESFFIVFTDFCDEVLDDFNPLGLSGNGFEEIPLDNLWSVTFDTKLGGPGTVNFERLHDWTTNKDDRIKYYSGTAIYKRDLPRGLNGKKIYLDLGDPAFIARVFINSVDAGVVWCSPWRLDITNYLNNDQNNIEIHVANSLVNRMVYDVSLPLEKRVTYAYPPVVKVDDELVPSGLTSVRLFVGT